MRLVAIVVALCLSAAALKYAPAPYAFIASCVAICAFVVSRLTSREWQKVIGVNVALIAVILGAVEVYFVIREATAVDQRVIYPPNYQELDPTLGYRPVKGVSGHARRFAGDTLIYDVIYTIGENGLRLAPATSGAPPEACVLFFGDSFTFGEGVADSETIPYLVGLRSGGTVHTFNFGFHGYGPHQMLAALQSARIDDQIDCRPTHAIYSAIPHHVSRAGGLAEFGRTGPRYRLAEDGHLFRDGSFADEEEAERRNRSPLVNELLDELAWQAGKSAAYRAALHRERRAQDAHFNLFFAIVAAARDEAVRTYPGLEFHTILWPNDAYPGVNERLRRGLESRGIRLHLVGEIVPDYDSNRAAYELHAADRHPNAKTYDLLADYVLDEIVRRGH